MITPSRFAIVSLAAATMFIGTAVAQQPQPNNNSAVTAGPSGQMPRMRMRRRGMRMHGIARGIHELNLTDQQRQQMRSIAQSQFQSTQTQRQELRQLAEKRRTGTLTDAEMARVRELRQQLMQSRQGVRTQMVAVLTADQKAKLEEMRKTRRENRGKLRPPRQRII